MPFAAIEAYLNNLPVVQAEWQMVVADAAAYPHLQEDGRKALARKWEKLVNDASEVPAPAKPVSPRVNEALLNMIGIGVRHGPGRS